MLLMHFNSCNSFFKLYKHFLNLFQFRHIILLVLKTINQFDSEWCSVYTSNYYATKTNRSYTFQ